MKLSTFKNYIQSELVRRARNSLRALPPKNDSTTPRRLFVDVSVVANHDAETGIQRIVRAVASQLVKITDDDWEVLPVGASRKRPYHVIGWPFDDQSEIKPLSLVARTGDVFLGLDFALDTVCFHKRQLKKFKKQGGELWFVMYDLLPLQRSDWFSDLLTVRFRKWLCVLASIADGFYCISKPVQDDLLKELATHYGIANEIPSVVLEMGWDLSGSRPSTGLPLSFNELLTKIAKSPTALMVGTIEPRKGHKDILNAFNSLWQKGSNYNLVIVGRPGWKTDQLQMDLLEHPQNGQKLFWLNDASDEALTKLYEMCTGVIIASHGEGFGLPLIEAFGYGKCVLARDIEIFRMHEDKGLSYFDRHANSNELAELIEKWFGIIEKMGPINLTPKVNLVTWSDVAASILSHLKNGAV